MKNIIVGLFLFFMLAAGAITPARSAEIEKVINERAVLVIERIKAKDWGGLYRGLGVSQVQDGTEEEFMQWPFIEKWSNDDFKIDDYELAQVYVPGQEGLSESEEAGQAIATVQLTGNLPAEAETAVLMITFKNTQGNRGLWCLYAITEMPQ